MLMSSLGGLLRLVAMLFANNYHEYVPHRLNIGISLKKY